MATGDLSLATPKTVVCGGLDLDNINLRRDSVIVVYIERETGGQHRVTVRQGGACVGFSWDGIAFTTVNIQVAGAYNGAVTALRSGGFQGLTTWLRTNGIVVLTGTVE